MLCRYIYLKTIDSLPWWIQAAMFKQNAPKSSFQIIMIFVIELYSLILLKSKQCFTKELSKK